MNIVIANRQRKRKINPRRLKEIAEALLADLRIKEAGLGINLVAARKMTLINETFLRHKGLTDVITFDYAISVGQASSLSHSKTKYGDRRDACPTLHGEIFICVNEAISQSEKFKTTWQSEIVRYLVHGVLHLLGHDDERPAARRRMRQEENRLLRKLSRRFSLAQLGRAIKLAA